MSQLFTIRVKQCRPQNDFVLAQLGNNLVQANFSQGDKSQLWTMEFNQWENGDSLVAAYSIVNAASGLAAMFFGSGRPIIVAPFQLGGPASCWRLDSVGGGGYYAINRWDDSEVMDVQGDSCDPGTPVISWAWNGGDNQRWRLDPA